MKIKINKNNFSNILEEVTKIINPNNALVSLQGILIDVMENKVIFTSSNGNLSMKKEIEVDSDIEVIKPGRILVPGKIFKEIIKKQDDIIEISEENNSISIRSRGTDANINLLDTEDYPVISFDSLGDDFDIEVSEFKSLISDVGYASADNDKRLILNGVNLIANEGKLSASATNSFRLAYKSISIPENISFNVTILSSNLKNILPSDAAGLFKISINDSKIITKYNNTTIVSNLIDGIYPELKKLIPTEFENVIEITTVELSKIIDKVLVMSTERKRVTKLTVSKDRMTFEMKRDEIGQTVSSTPNFKLTKGEGITIPFDIQYLKDTLSKVSGEIKLCFNNPNKAFIVFSRSKQSFVQLILPHRSY